MKYFIASALAKLLDTVFLQKHLPGVPIIFYHAIGNDKSKLFVTRAAFERQMRYLSKRGYRSILPAELKNVSPKDKVFLITFDDGFKSVHDVAWPILAKYGFKATVFIATDFIGQSSVYARSEADRQFPLMSALEIKELAAANWCLANHCASHQNLTTLTPAEIKLEYNRALDALQSLGLGSYKDIVAYPFNRYNTTVVDILREQGAVMAFTGGNRLYSQIENSLALPRFAVDNYFAKFVLIFSPTFHRLKNFLQPYAR